MISDERVSVYLSTVEDANIIRAINRTKGKTLSDRVRNCLQSVTETPAEEMMPSRLDRTVHNDEPARFHRVRRGGGM